MALAARIAVFLGVIALGAAPALLPSTASWAPSLDTAARADDGASDGGGADSSGADSSGADNSGSDSSGSDSSGSDSGGSDSSGSDSGSDSGGDTSDSTGGTSGPDGSSASGGASESESEGGAGSNDSESGDTAGGDAGNGASGGSDSGAGGGSAGSGAGGASDAASGGGSGGAGVSTGGTAASSGGDAPSGSNAGPEPGASSSSGSTGASGGSGGGSSGATDPTGAKDQSEPGQTAASAGAGGSAPTPAASVTPSEAPAGSASGIGGAPADTDPVDQAEAPKSDYQDPDSAPRSDAVARDRPGAASDVPSKSLPEAIAGLLGMRPANTDASASAASATPATAAPATGDFAAAVSSDAVAAEASAAPVAPAPSLAEVPAAPGATRAPSLGEAISTLLGGGNRQPGRDRLEAPAAAAPVPSVAPDAVWAPAAPAQAQVAAPAARVPVATATRSPATIASSSQAPRKSPVARAARIAPSSGSGPSFRQYELTALGLTPRARQVVGALGFRILSERRSRLLGNQIVAKLRTPRHQSPESALRRLQATLPELVFDYAHLYKSTGETIAAPVRYAADLVGVPETGACRVETRVGLIDTGVGRHPTLVGADITQRSFVARDASRNVLHGTAVASLLVGSLPGATPLAPGVRLYSANVFAGEGKALRADALAIIEALDWMAAQKVAVVNLSLMGPDNALLARAVQAAAERGLILVAAAGNAGPDAPPAYPAAYPAVISVAAVDERGRPYARNNRGGYVELAAPGVDIWAADARGGEAFWTGTSFAVPFVTATVARDVGLGRARNVNDSRRLLAASARDLGAPGRDPIFGHGLVSLGGCNGGAALSARNR